MQNKAESIQQTNKQTNLEFELLKFKQDLLNEIDINLDYRPATLISFSDTTISLWNGTAYDLRDNFFLSVMATGNQN